MAVDLLSQILPSLKSHIYPASISLTDWKLREGHYSTAFAPKLNDFSWKSHTIPAPWGGYDKTAWFRRQVVIPLEFAGKQVVLLLDIPESLVYVNGKAFQGVDQNHQEILLTTKARTGQSFFVAIEAYSGRKKEQSIFHSAKLAVVNPTARALYFGLSALHELEKILGPSATEAKEIRELIRQTLIFLKYFKPEGEEYPNAIGRAHSFLMRTLETACKTDIQGLVHLISQSHIDVVWLWRLRETRRKCARTFSTALRMMEEFPEFTFSQPQAVRYEITKKSYPDIYKEIKQRITDGRWRPIGSMWVEPDCNIPNGESLVRQILYGKRFFKKEFGIDSDILWLPDTFGFNAALPQILKKSGIKYFSTTKLTWNDTNQFPHNTFWWQGIDGSKILTHIPPVGLEGRVIPNDLKKSWDDYNEQETSPHVLQTFGYGDGGGGPAKEDLDAAAILRTIVGLPSSTLSTVTRFFNQIEGQARSLKVWHGELYLEKHRGTFTTHGWVKRENRLAETLLYNTELLSSLAMVFGKGGPQRGYPQETIESAWKNLLLNQFHDVVPGTSIADAYEDTRKDFAAIRTSCKDVQDRARGVLAERENGNPKEFRFSVFNSLSWQRSDYVVLEIKTKEPGFLVFDADGNTVKHQVIGKKDGVVQLLCFVENLPPFSFRRLVVSTLAKKEASDRPWKVTSRVVETTLFRVRLDSKGQLSSIYDKTLRRELVGKSGKANRFQTFKDLPKQWDAWDIDPEYASKEFDTLRLKSMKVVEEGPLRATIRVLMQSERRSRISQDISLYHTLPRIDFRTTVYWKERQTLLKVAFPLNVKTNVATYDIPFGAIQRSTKSTDSWHKAKYEVPGQQWADLSESKFGVSLLNDCKYGYDARDGNLRLTLIRSPFYPHPVEPWRFNDEKVTDQGEHTFAYALWPHNGNWREGRTVARAREFNNPFVVTTGSIAPLQPLLRVSSESIIIDSVKKAEDFDEIVVRAHEAHGQTVKTTFEFGAKVDQALACDLMENETEALTVSKSKLALKFAPFEIKTFRLKFRSKR